MMASLFSFHLQVVVAAQELCILFIYLQCVQKVLLWTTPDWLTESATQAEIGVQLENIQVIII